MNQRKNDERRSIEAARLLLMEKTIDTQAARISALESLLARCGDLLATHNIYYYPLKDIVAEIDAILPATDSHDSDCATHNMPAYPNGDCDCSLATEGKKE